MTNHQVRQWYKTQVAPIPSLNENWIREGLSPEARARRAWQIRRDARLTARQMMEDPIEVNLLKARDLKEYGDPNGPTFEFLVEKARKDGFEGDKIYEEIISESYSTNKLVDKKFE